MGTVTGGKAFADNWAVRRIHDLLDIGLGVVEHAAKRYVWIFCPICAAKSGTWHWTCINSGTVEKLDTAIDI